MRQTPPNSTSRSCGAARHVDTEKKGLHVEYRLVEVYHFEGSLRSDTILKRRYARGEINREEYDERLADVRKWSRRSKMRRLLIFAGFAVGVSLAMRKEIAERAGPAMRERCSEMCDRFLANMPDSFPPKRIMADLDVLKGRTARILEVLEEREEVRRPKRIARSVAGGRRREKGKLR